MRTSLFELFKIGIGPSSSHTVGPMRAAREFALALEAGGHLADVRSVRTELYGSLALTGVGHGTDRAVLLGLTGETPAGVDPGQIENTIRRIRDSGRLSLLGTHPIEFHEPRDLLFRKDLVLPGHPNAMHFTALTSDDRIVDRQTYFSIGGGFITREGDRADTASTRAGVPYPFSSAAKLLAIGHEYDLPIWSIVMENEKAWRSEREIRDGIARIWTAMRDCVSRGLETDGTLPGGLNVQRRAPRLFAKLRARGFADPLAAIDWVNVFAIAANEENAAGGRVVTAPTNGAAGIIPAVALYYRDFMPAYSAEGIVRYFLTASAIGVLYKENASISGAEVGCQGEVGVACSMAAAGLVGALGGSNEEIEHAAEIAMEHNLGMTCDPIGGLVQIPCIERNAIGAVKAINATRMAMNESGDHKVSLDQVIKTMYQTGLDMQSRYKETSLAGLAVNVVEC